MNDTTIFLDKPGIMRPSFLVPSSAGLIEKLEKIYENSPKETTKILNGSASDTVVSVGKMPMKKEVKKTLAKMVSVPLVVESVKEEKKS